VNGERSARPIQRGSGGPSEEARLSERAERASSGPTVDGCPPTARGSAARGLPPLLATCAALLLLACKGDAAPPPIAAPGISQVADTTFVTTEEPGLDGVVTLTERWQQAADRDRFGDIVGGGLGTAGTVWFAVTGGRDGAAIYRADRGGALRAIARQGIDPGAFTGAVSLAALADGGMLAVERTTGRAVRFDSLGVPTDTLALSPLPTAGEVVADRDGGWFVPLADGGGWLHHSRLGEVTDTILPSSEWSSNATIAVGRDGSLLRAVVGTSQLARRAGSGAILTGRWIGPPLAGILRLAHDARGLLWVAATAADGGTRLHSFDRDGGLRFVIDTPPGTTVLDEDGEYVLTVSVDGALRVMEVVNGELKDGNQALTRL